MSDRDLTLNERIARLEILQDTIAKRAAEDRAAMKADLAEVREDIAGVSKSVSEVTSTLRSLADQIIGGRRVLHALWVVGAAFVAIMAWASGLLQKVGLLPLVR